MDAIIAKRLDTTSTSSTTPTCQLVCCKL